MNPGGTPPPPPCPPVAPAPEGALAWISGCEIKIAQPIRFDTNKERLRPETLPVLDAVADIILRDKALHVEVRAHINHTGATYGRDLSKQRAQSVARYLIEKKGVDPAQVVPKGYGDTVPVADPKTEEGRTKNRRIEFILFFPTKLF